MAAFLHLLKGPSLLAAPVIEQNSRERGAEVTVVLLHGAPAPPLPDGVRLRRFGEAGLDYSSLLDLIFASDHVVTW